MAAKTDYEAWLRSNFEDLIDKLELNDLQKKIIKSRWLDQLIYFEKTAARVKRRYQTFRITAILGGILVTLIGTLHLPDIGSANLGVVLTSLTGAIVAAVGGLEGFLHYGDQTRQYRQSAEILKIEAWSFFSLTGEYGGFAKHADGYAKFAERVEDIIRLDVRSVMSKTTQKDEGKQQDTDGEESAQMEHDEGAA